MKLKSLSSAWDTWQFSKSFCRVRGTPLSSPKTWKHILFVGSGGPSRTQYELCLMNAFLLDGHRVSAISWEIPALKKLYDLLPDVPLHYWHQFTSLPPEEKAVKLMNVLPDYDAFLNFEDNGVRIGRHAVNTALRMEYRGHLDPAVPGDVALLGKHVRDVFQAAAAAEKILDTLQPDIVYFGDYGYTWAGSLFDTSRRRGLPVIGQWWSYKSNHFTFKRIRSEDPDADASAMSEPSWELVRDSLWTKEAAKTVQKEITGSYERGEWFNMVISRKKNPFTTKKEFLQSLHLNPKKKVAVLFCPMLTDCPLYYGKSLFHSYENWLIASVRSAIENPNLNWLIKLHPGNLSIMDGVTTYGDSLELAAIGKHFKKLPDHVQILPSNYPVTAFELYKFFDYVLTPRGTSGLEASMQGISVVSAGSGRFDRKGFSIDPETAEEYQAILAKIETLPALTHHQIELAEKCAYGIFMLKPIRFESFSYILNNDPAASAKIRVNAKSAKEYINGPDIRRFLKWAIEEKSEDFLEEAYVRNFTDRPHA